MHSNSIEQKKMKICISIIIIKQQYTSKEMRCQTVPRLISRLNVNKTFITIFKWNL